MWGHRGNLKAMMRGILVSCLVGVLLLLAMGCASQRPQDDVLSQPPGGPAVSMIVSNSDLAVGENRLSFGLVDRDYMPVRPELVELQAVFYEAGAPQRAGSAPHDGAIRGMAAGRTPRDIRGSGYFRRKPGRQRPRLRASGRFTRRLRMKVGRAKPPPPRSRCRRNTGRRSLGTRRRRQIRPRRRGWPTCAPSAAASSRIRRCINCR